MKYHPVVTADAIEDLQQLKVYLDELFGMPTRRHVIGLLESQMRTLTAFPFSGQSISELAVTTERPYLLYRSKKNVILYDLDDKYMRVRFLRLIDNRRDYVSELRTYLLGDE